MHESPPAAGPRENGREWQVGAGLLTGFVRKGRGEGRHQLEKNGQSRENFFFKFFLTEQCCLWNLSSQTRDGSWVLGSERAES